MQTKEEMVMIATREAQIFTETIVVGVILTVIYFALLWLNRNNRVECYAPVELSGMLCIIPEIFMSVLLTVPCALWIGFFSLSNAVVPIMIYFGILFIYRKSIITYMNKA